ncbi:MAG: helix-turn-helix domain-containing protein [Rhodopila sp.]
MALGACHARSRKRFLALYDIAQGKCATQMAKRTGRHLQTVMGWLHTYNERGPEALRYQRSGGRASFARTSPPRLASRSAPRQAASLPVAGAEIRPCWTLRRLAGFVRAQFARCCRETIRRALHRLGLLWKS